MLYTKGLVFCTAFIDGNRQRYQDWIDYYSDFFVDEPVDLLMVHDGPTNVLLDLKNVIFYAFPEHFGRVRVWLFPGWKRSFHYGLKYAREFCYNYLAHIESDCFIRKCARGEFLRLLYSQGYYTGFTKKYNFPETGLQILNDNVIRNYFLDRYSCEENFSEEIDFEKFIKENLSPKYILEGERFEGVEERFEPHYTYMSGISLADFRRLFGND